MTYLSSSSRLALIDAPGMLTLLDLEVRIPEDEDRYVMFSYVMSCHVITLNVFIFYFIFFIYNFLIYLNTIFLFKIGQLYFYLQDPFEENNFLCVEANFK